MAGVMQVISKPSPNQNDRPAGTKISLVVLHSTEGSDAGALEWMCNPVSRVSAHYLIARDGAVYQLVDEAKRAWHAGRSWWRGVTDCNDYSIGIEIGNRAPEPYTDAQYKSLGGLLAEICDRHRLTMTEIVGHYHVAPGRKIDPGYHFHWGRAMNEMLARWDHLEGD